MKIPILHDASHVINDVFGNYICRDLPGNKRKLFDKEVSKYVKRTKSMIYTIKTIIQIHTNTQENIHFVTTSKTLF